MQISKEEEIRLDCVRQKIIDEISEQVDEVLPFDRFMDIALYSHKYGYYEKLGKIFGKLGDFTTAPEMGIFLPSVFKMKSKMYYNKLGEIFMSWGLVVVDFQKQFSNVRLDFN